MEQQLFKTVGRKVYRVLRRSTDRPEIGQRMTAIEAMPSGDIEEPVVAQVSSFVKSLKGLERALIFCASRKEYDRMADLLRWKPYHSSVPPEDRSRHLRQWKDGLIAGLACTSMLNCCLDYPCVKFVFHLGPPRDIVDYHQAIGRLARNGKPGTAIVFYDPHALREPDNNDAFGSSVIYDMLCDESLCRRLRLRPAFFS